MKHKVETEKKLTVKTYRVDPTETPGIDCSGDEPITQQHTKDECDINILMKRYAESGEPIPQAVNQVFGDISNIPDYQTALNHVIAAQDAFNAQPADIRNKFDNNPQKMFEFLHDDKNYEEAKKLGLLDNDRAEQRQEQREAKAAKRKLRENAKIEKQIQELTQKVSVGTNISSDGRAPLEKGTPKE